MKFPLKFVVRGTLTLLGTMALLAGTVFTQSQLVSSQDQSGHYFIRADRPRQVIRGLGVEIQSDSIASGNKGMPDRVVAIPHDLTPSEQTRFYRDMLHGFRYVRLAMGLYLRGLDRSQQHIIERYPGQMNDLRTLQNVSGIEGFDVEYWSPAPYWKTTKSYESGSIVSTNPVFIDRFTDALVEDVRYLRSHGLNVTMWGLQNEPAIGKVAHNGTKVKTTLSYSRCFYTQEDYYAVLKVAAPKIRAILPDVQIHVNSWDGAAGQYADLIRKDPVLLRNIDAWTWHQIGHNSNDQIDFRDKYMMNAVGKPVYQNEFEYQPWSQILPKDRFMNTAQSIMNWFTFEDSPTWFWLHALKPIENAEASGYALGFWRSRKDEHLGKLPEPQPGHWIYNPQNWNAVAGFLRYLPWDSTRLSVDEDVVRHDQRILVWQAKDGRIGIALSNRGTQPFTFHLRSETSLSLIGHRYTINRLDHPIGTVTGAYDITITVPSQCLEFWISE